LLLSLILLLGGCDSGGTANGEHNPADILFHDDFGPATSARWRTEADASGSAGVVNEQMVIELNTPNVMQYVSLAEGLFADFAVEVDATLLAGSADSSYGVLLRLNDVGQFYRFEITGSGLYVVERRNADGTWARLVPEWTPSPFINKGVNAANQLRVVAEGSNFAFYVNDQLLHQVTDATLPSGTIALDAGTFGQIGLQVGFDNLYVLRR
jgi:hypothetical protein